MARFNIKPYIFIAPALIYLSIWIFYPILNALVLSFFDSPTGRSRDYFWVGIENYFKLLQDDLFLKSLYHNIIWVLLSIASACCAWVCCWLSCWQAGAGRAWSMPAFSSSRIR